ncbi:MAG: peptidyl-prolyl cis-trans isomerase A (cyclophilin A) [Salibacteraceae bacterium]|jgi:peptidyl-prolyl cis-trans isomerase A (cyclophilin A)
MRFLFIGVLVLSILSCRDSVSEKEADNEPSTSVNRETKTALTATKKKKKTAKKKSHPKITNQNVVSFLTKYGENNKETVIRLTCKFGDIDIKLYTNTPLHRADMIYLTKQGYFDLTQFYRVSSNFVDQAGNSDEWDCQEKRAEIGGYTIPSEFNTVNIHTYGSVAMARRYDKNPTKRSSPFEFYISLGRTYTPVEIRAHEREFDTDYSDQQKELYATIGGLPYLDQQHTVIGEVIKGMEVARALNKVKVDGREWPLTEIGITMSVIR